MTTSLDVTESGTFKQLALEHSPREASWCSSLVVMDRFSGKGADYAAQGTLKVPPGWSELYEREYPLRLYMQDLALWSAATDVLVERQGPAAAMQLNGIARSLAREMSADELRDGHVEVDPNTGQQTLVSGIALLLRRLKSRIGALDEEQAIESIDAFLSFRRLQGEHIDMMLSRHELIAYKRLW